MIVLTEDQKRHLRRLGHDLKPVVRTGQAGLTEAVLTEIDGALAHHELVKIKVIADDKAQRRACVDEVCRRMEATLAQSVGQVALLYRPNPRKKGSRIALP